MQFFPCVKITGANSINSISKPPDKKSSLMDVFYKIWAWNKPTMHRAISIFMNILYGRWQKPFQANQNPTNKKLSSQHPIIQSCYHETLESNFPHKCLSQLLENRQTTILHTKAQIHIYRFSQPKCPSIFKAHLKDF